MNLRLVVIFLLATAPLLLRAQDKAIESLNDKRSYSIGYNIGKNLSTQGVDPSFELLFQGIQDGASQGDPALSQQEMQETLQSLAQEIQQRQRDEQKKVAEENQAKGEAFLAANKKKPDVKTLPSGLQYKVINEGSGQTPAANDRVKVHYRGTLLDGTEFDSSYQRGQPATFAVNRVIKGWTQALQKMKEGAKWKLFIPAELAYGARGNRGNIGPNETLIFDIELLSVESTKPKKQEPVTSDIIKVPSKAELEKGAQIEVIKKEDLEKETEKQRKAKQD